jgi:hypothetical protein
MTLLTLMDALQVHAAAAAVTAGGAAFKDVAVGFAAARGRCVRIFYAGERDVEHYTSQMTLTSRLIAQAVTIRAMWPSPETATKANRVLEGQIGTFVYDFRTRVLGDSQLGSAAVDLNLGLAILSQQVISGTSYAIAEMEAVIDGDEFARAP